MPAPSCARPLAAPTRERLDVVEKEEARRLLAELG